MPPTASIDAHDLPHRRDDAIAPSPIAAATRPTHGPTNGSFANRHTVVGIGMLAAASAAYILRNPASVTAPTMWAEEGTVFFKEAVERGWGALLDPHAGQLIVVPRAIAAAVAPFPVAIQPTLYAIAATLVVVLSCGIVLSARWRGAVPIGARFACLTALVCMPGVGETYANIANSHWWLGIGLVLLGMLRDPDGRPGRVGELAFVAAAATSGFVALYGLPTLAVRALSTRSRHSLLLVGTALVGVAIQVGFLLTSARRGDLAAIGADPLAAVLVLGKRVFATLVLGDGNLAVLWPLDAPSILALLAASVAAAAFLVAWTRSSRLETAALVAAVVGGLVLALWAVTPPGASVSMLFWSGAASRFFLVPKAALLVTLVASWSHDRAWQTTAAVVGVLLVVGIASDYRVTPLPAVEWAPFARCVDHSSAECSTVIPPGWTLEVTGRGG